MQELHGTVRSEIQRKMRRKTGRETSEEHGGGPYPVYIRETRRSGKFSSGTCYTDIGMEMVEVAGERLLGNKVEVKTCFINDENI